jgi:prolyl-tRNA editing enzyme YbaK/EbsC (Cys-tRNA(Pro) deacylase)
VLGVSPSEIVKTLIVICAGRPLAILAPGDRRVSFGKVARALSCGSTDARLATPDEVRAITELEPGALSPIPLPEEVRVFLDRSFLTKRRIWAGAGTPNHLFACAPGDLAALAHAEVLDAVEAGG